jgi:hypothetical protein
VFGGQRDQLPFKDPFHIFDGTCFRHMLFEWFPRRLANVLLQSCFAAFFNHSDLPASKPGFGKALVLLLNKL